LKRATRCRNRATIRASSTLRADLIYFESPHLFDEADCRVIADGIAARRRRRGNHASPPWTTIATAISELEEMDGQVSQAFRTAFLDLR
jgi:exodeoxyribonuclease-1